MAVEGLRALRAVELVAERRPTGIGPARHVVAIGPVALEAILPLLATEAGVVEAAIAVPAAFGIVIAEPTRHFVAGTIEKAAVVAARTTVPVIAAGRRIIASAAAVIASIGHWKLLSFGTEPSG